MRRSWLLKFERWAIWRYRLSSKTLWCCGFYFQTCINVQSVRKQHFNSIHLHSKFTNSCMEPEWENLNRGSTIVTCDYSSILSSADFLPAPPFSRISRPSRELAGGFKHPNLASFYTSANAVWDPSVSQWDWSLVNQWSCRSLNQSRRSILSSEWVGEICGGGTSRVSAGCYLVWSCAFTSEKTYEIYLPPTEDLIKRRPLLRQQTFVV